MKQYISILCGLLLPLTIFSQHTISGQVTMPNAVGVCEVLVLLVDANGVILDQEMTQDDGVFSFENQAAGQDYSLEFLKEGNAANGVSTFDLVLMSRHILGVEPFSSTEQELAADVNNSEFITTLDLVYCRKVILGIDAEFPNATSWKFVNDPNQSLDNLNADVDLDIRAVKTGDVNGSATACE